MLSHVYEKELRTVGLRISQFTLLQALDMAPGISQKQLAELLNIDSTTLTRNLALLEKQRLVQIAEADDRRSVRLSLTRYGRQRFNQAASRWEAAQEKMRNVLGREWAQVEASIMKLTESAKAVR